MKIVLIQVGETIKGEIANLTAVYAKRINHICRFEVHTVPTSKNRANKPVTVQKKEEANNIIGQFKKGDRILLLDEHGDEPDSKDLAGIIDAAMKEGIKRLVFIIGGPHGLDPGLDRLALKKIALSRLTFPHQLVRLLFVEQIYRALTIIRGLPYHND